MKATRKTCKAILIIVLLASVSAARLAADEVLDANEVPVAEITLAEDGTQLAVQPEAALDLSAAEGQTPDGFKPFSIFTNLSRMIFNADFLTRLINVALTILTGIILISLTITILKRLAHRRLDPRSSALIIKIIQYSGIALIAMNALKAAQVDLSPLLGAAGIVGIALGFAAQTSVSNFISGFFLVSEKAFTVGDIVTIDTMTGVVFSIDTLSIKLRAFDNRLIRIPNETLIKSNMINLTRFPIRRLNITMTVPYDTDIEKAKAILLDIAAKHPTVLLHPEPFFMIQGFSNEGISLFIGVWFSHTDWEPTNNGMHFSIKQRFDEAGIRFAYPTFNLNHTQSTEQLLAEQAGAQNAGRQTDMG